MFHTQSVWFLLLLLIIPILAYSLFRKRAERAIAFSSVEPAAALSRTWRQRLAWVPNALLLLTIFLLIVALARPQEGRKQTVTDSEGIAIELVIDRSSSMQALDFQLDGENVDRLTAIKEVAGRFIRGGDGLDGRFSDLVGMIVFAGYADGVVPPTLDHGFLVSQLTRTEIVRRRREDGTAIGDAVGLAVEKLSGLGGKSEDQSNHKIKSKVIILLTDGENTAGEIEPIPAAELAESMDIKIYTIGVGTKGQAPFPVPDPLTGRIRYRHMEVNIDEDTLRKMADTTGGQYFRATDTDSLKKIYAEIDALEKSNVESRQYVDYRELAVEPIVVNAWTVPPLVTLAFATLVAQLVLSNTVLRQMS